MFIAWRELETARQWKLTNLTWEFTLRNYKYFVVWVRGKKGGGGGGGATQESFSNRIV